MSRISRELERPKGSGIERLALRPREAAQALGVSERKFRELLPELPHVRRGGVVLVPVEPLRRWLEEKARAEAGRAEAVVEEVLESIRRYDRYLDNQEV